MLGAWILKAHLLLLLLSSSSSAIAHFLAQNAKHFNADTTVCVLANHNATALCCCGKAASDGNF